MPFRATCSRTVCIDPLESRILFDVLSFTASGNLIANDRPQKPVLADLLNNGRLDIVEPDQLSNTVSIFLNNGNGTFGPDEYVHVGSLPYAVAVGDFNNDGILDIAVVNRSDDDVQVLLGNGNGTFQAPMNFQVGSNPEAIAVGDFNGDGNLDIATANEGDGSISVLMGNGNGTFQTQQTYTIGANTNPAAIAVGDLNSNGPLDIVTADAGADEVSVFMNNSNGTFANAVNYSVAVGDEPTDIALGDFQNNGILDIVTADQGVGANSISVLLGNGDGTFQPYVEYMTSALPQTVTIGDMNGDGNLDVITSSDQNQTLDILEGNGNGTFQPVQSIVDPNNNDDNYITVGDITGDGKLDIVTSGNGQENLFFNTTQFDVPSFATLSNGVLTVQGTAGNDKIGINYNSSGDYVVRENQRTPESFPAYLVNTIFAFGGTGNDTIAVSANVPIGVHLDGGVGDDSLSGGSGNDTLTGDGGSDTLSGNAGNDSIVGGGGNDVIHGGAGNDTLWGGQGNDTLYGGAGDNVLYGKAGDDVLYSAVGATDTIYGGLGNDTCYANGTDQFPNNDVESIIS